MKMSSTIYGQCDSYSEENVQKILDRHANTKAVLIQASSYILAFTLSLLPPLLMLIGVDGRFSLPVTTELEKISLILLPLQGFFNACIFISHKVYNFKRVHAHASICHVLSLLLTTSLHDPVFISRISIIKQDDPQDNDANGNGNDHHNNINHVHFSTKSMEEEKQEELSNRHSYDSEEEDYKVISPKQNYMYEVVIQDESQEELYIFLGGGQGQRNKSDFDNDNCSMNKNASCFNDQNTTTKILNDGITKEATGGGEVLHSQRVTLTSQHSEDVSPHHGRMHEAPCNISISTNQENKSTCSSDGMSHDFLNNWNHTSLASSKENTEESTSLGRWNLGSTFDGTSMEDAEQGRRQQKFYYKRNRF
jgi:hypothetical protein